MNDDAQVLLREILARLVRVETRLATLMEHEGMTVNSKGTNK